MRSETFEIRTPSTVAHRVDDLLAVVGVRRRDRDVAHAVGLATRTRSIAPRSPPASPMAAATLANDPATAGISTRIVRL